MNESKIKHLEFLQNCISRMANNSFIFKGWALTIVSAITTCAITMKEFYIALMAFLPAFVFCALDTYYLQLERKYRILYDKVAMEKPENIDFNMQLPISKKQDKTLYFQTLFSKSIIPFYSALIVIISIITVIIKFVMGGK